MAVVSKKCYNSNISKLYNFISTLDIKDVEVADLLSSTPSPLPPSKETLKLEAEKKDTLLDLSEFEILENNEKTSVSLTSNVAILAGEFSKPVEEEEDDFDAAFDALGIVSNKMSIVTIFWSQASLAKNFI